MPHDELSVRDQGRSPQLDGAAARGSSRADRAALDGPDGAGRGRARAGLPLVPGYEVDSLLGHGALGSTYLGRSRARPAIPVVIKVLVCGEDLPLRRELRQLVESACQLRHPNVVRTHGLVDVGRLSVGIVTERVPGGPLPLSGPSVPRAPSAAVPVLVALAEGLDAIHRAGLVHGDLHPGSVLLSACGDPVLSDVGIGRVMGRWSARRADYVDPAGCSGDGPGVRSDIYGLGVLAWELLAGTTPYAGRSRARAIRQAAKGKQPSLSRLSPALPLALCQVVDAALSPDPDARPSSAAELADSLRSCSPPGGRSHGREDQSADGPRVLLPYSRAAPPDGLAARAGSHEVRLPATWLRRIGQPRTVGRPVSREHWPCSSGSSRRRSRMRLAAVVVALGLCGALAVYRGVGATNPPAGASRREAASCPHGSAVLAPGETAVVSGLFGNGCANDRLAWSSGVVTIWTGRGKVLGRFAVGEPNDDLLVGDWRCSGSHAPALYRPSTGEVFFFDRWPGAGGSAHSVESSSSNVRYGRPRLLTSRHSCTTGVAVQRPRSPPRAP